MRTSMRILFVLFFFFLVNFSSVPKNELTVFHIEDNCGQTYEHTLALCGGFF